jgi:hypothetical protein
LTTGADGLRYRPAGAFIQLEVFSAGCPSVTRATGCATATWRRPAAETPARRDDPARLEPDLRVVCNEPSEADGLPVLVVEERSG